MENQPNQFEQTPVYGPQTPLPNATAVLVLGIVSIVGCLCYGVIGLICGIIALVLGNKDLKLYRANPTAYTPGSYNNVKSGRICAIIGLALSAAYIIYVIVIIATVGTAILSNPSQFFNK